MKNLPVIGFPILQKQQISDTELALVLSIENLSYQLHKSNIFKDTIFEILRPLSEYQTQLIPRSIFRICADKILNDYEMDFSVVACAVESEIQDYHIDIELDDEEKMGRFGELLNQWLNAHPYDAESIIEPCFVRVQDESEQRSHSHGYIVH